MVPFGQIPGGYRPPDWNSKRPFAGCVGVGVAIIVAISVLVLLVLLGARV